MVDPGTGAPARLYGAPAPSTYPRWWRRWSTTGSSCGAPVPWRRRRTWTRRPRWRRTATGSPPRPASSLPAPPTVWCSWYRYFEKVTADDVRADLRAFDDHDLVVDVVQVDDGWSTGLGEGLGSVSTSGRYPRCWTTSASPDAGSGLWLAPFLVGAHSTLATEHPDWVVGPAGRNWGDDLVGLDLDAHRRPRPAGHDVRVPGGPRRRLPQARLPLRRCPERRRGLPLRPVADPGGGRTGRLPGRLRRSPPPVGRPGRRDARLAGHLPRGRRVRRPRPARADAVGRSRLAAGPPLGQRPGLRGRAAVVRRPRAVGFRRSGLRRAAVVLRPGRGARRLGPVRGPRPAGRRRVGFTVLARRRAAGRRVAAEELG